MGATSGKRAHPPHAADAKARAAQKARPAAKRPASASQLRAQTRKLLGKHYRAKYGVR